MTDKRGTVRDILREMERDSVNRHGLHGYMITEYAKQVCQQFPKTPDNPDGYLEPTRLDK